MKYSFSIISAICVILQMIRAQTTNNDLFRVLSTGSILKGAKAITSDNITVYLFLGIPYAEPPINENRYKAPLTRTKWDGVLDASYYKVSCLHNSWHDDENAMIGRISEDCLHTNVITSEACLKNGSCAVAVYFFNQTSFNPATMETILKEDITGNWATKDIVMVTINFRLQSFGFLNMGEKTSAVKNAGILDQLEALKWIKKEISRFGGDANKVTLVGSSNGAINADLLAISPLTNGLFNQIAVFNGAAGTTQNVYENTNLAATRELAVEANCTTEYAWESSNKENIVKCLRAKDAIDLLRIQQLLETRNEAYTFSSPVRDVEEWSAVIPDSIIAMNKKRRPCPLLIGRVLKTFDSMENRLGLKEFGRRGDYLNSMCKSAINIRQLNVTNALAKACEKEYSTDLSVSNVGEDITLTLPIYDSASANTRNGGTTFLFEYRSDDDNSMRSGFSQPVEVIAAIAQFIKTGNPSVGQTSWQPLMVDRNNFVTITSISPPVNMDGYHDEVIRFWTEIAPAIEKKMEWYEKNWKNFMEILLQAKRDAVSSLKGHTSNADIRYIYEQWKRTVQEAINRYK